MAKLVFDESGKRFYETGVSKGVLYVQDTNGSYPQGVAWNGLTAVNEAPSGAEATPLYADDIKYLELRSAEEFGATIEAYTYPDEFEQCDGSAELAVGVKVGQQARKSITPEFQNNFQQNIVDRCEYDFSLQDVYDTMYKDPNEVTEEEVFAFRKKMSL